VFKHQKVEQCLDTMGKHLSLFVGIMLNFSFLRFLPCISYQENIWRFEFLVNEKEVSVIDEKAV